MELTLCKIYDTLITSSYITWHLPFLNRDRWHIFVVAYYYIIIFLNSAEERHKFDKPKYATFYCSNTQEAKRIINLKCCTGVMCYLVKRNKVTTYKTIGGLQWSYNVLYCLFSFSDYMFMCVCMRYFVSLLPFWTKRLLVSHIYACFNIQRNCRNMVRC